MIYFLPINSVSLAHYFICACIKPTKYFKNKVQDIQDKFNNSLFLLDGLGSIETDCCLEIVLTEDEAKHLIHYSDSCYLLPIPLPISRVKKIHFNNKEQMDRTLANINISSAFVPRSLATVSKLSNVVIENRIIDNNLHIDDYSRQIITFDRILGALALMKTAKEPYMNYSENYASTLSFFNTSIKDQLKRQGIRINDKFFGLFSKSGSFVKYIHYLEKEISKEDLDKIAAEDNQIIERSYTKAINFEKLNGITYAFAILQSYGVGDEASFKKIDNLIIKNFKNLKDDMSEGIALYYGYNRGYSVFNNSYGTEVSKKQNFKYLLNSKLDYYTIESVYQFAFYNNTTSSTFPHIDEWCPKQQQVPKKKKDYMVLDIAFIGKKKPSVFSEKYLQDFLANIKEFDFLKNSLSSLIEHTYKTVVSDTIEEFQEDSENKINEIIAEWSRKFNNAEKEITSLKEEKAFLTKEIELLKSNNNLQYNKEEVNVSLLSESIVNKDSNTNDNEVVSRDDLTDIIKLSNKDSNKQSEITTEPLRQKEGSKHSKKPQKCVQTRKKNKVTIETQVINNDNTSNPSSIIEEKQLPFKDNE